MPRLKPNIPPKSTLPITTGYRIQFYRDITSTKRELGLSA